MRGVELGTFTRRRVPTDTVASNSACSFSTYFIVPFVLTLFIHGRRMFARSSGPQRPRHEGAMNLKAKCAFSIGFLGLLCLMVPSSARADLVGTTVTGSLDFDADNKNFYIPAMGFVPAGFQNSAGAQDSNTVVIVGGNEFGFSDDINTDVTSFSSTGFTFTDTSITAGPNLNIILTMTDSAFTGVSLISSTFPGLTFGISGDQITVDIPGLNASADEV